MKLTYCHPYAKPERMKDFYVKYLGAVGGQDEPRPVGKEGPEADTGLADPHPTGPCTTLSFEAE